MLRNTTGEQILADFDYRTSKFSTDLAAPDGSKENESFNRDPLDRLP